MLRLCAFPKSGGPAPSPAAPCQLCPRASRRQQRTRKLRGSPAEDTRQKGKQQHYSFPCGTRLLSANSVRFRAGLVSGENGDGGSRPVLRLVGHRSAQAARFYLPLVPCSGVRKNNASRKAASRGVSSIFIQINFRSFFFSF